MTDFLGQRNNEKVLLVFRRHLITARRGIAFSILLLLCGILGICFFFQNEVMLWASLVLVLFALFALAYAIILWYFSFYLVTTSRLRQIRQKGFFKKTVVDLELENIQSLSFGVPGALANLFNYGTILVQTPVGDLTLSYVRDPEQVYNKLENAVYAAKHVQNL